MAIAKRQITRIQDADDITDPLTLSHGLVAPTIKPIADSTTAVRVQTVGGADVVIVDTINSGVQLAPSGGRFGVLGATPVVQPTALSAPVVGTINTGDAETDALLLRMSSRITQLEQKLSQLGMVAQRPATWTVTTVGAATHTIGELTVTRSTVVDWGDGTTSTYTGAGARTHNYAGAGTWTVTIVDPLAVTALTLRENLVTLNSASVSSMSNMLSFDAGVLKDGVFNSADIAAWRPTYFSISYTPGGFIGAFDSADISAWRPQNFYFNSVPGFTGTFDLAHLAAWRSEYFYCNAMPAAFVITLAAANFAAWTTTKIVELSGNALSEAQVDAILYGLYQASIAPRTVTGGTINLGGTNAAPSGTFQAAAACPVTVATDGKEVAHELLNDTCAVGYNKWTTVTVTA